MVGLFVNMIRYQPPFFMPSLLGGVLWTSGEEGEGEAEEGERGREQGGIHHLNYILAFFFFTPLFCTLQQMF